MESVKFEWKMVILAFSIGYFIVALAYEKVVVAKLTSWNEKRKLRSKKQSQIERYGMVL